MHTLHDNSIFLCTRQPCVLLVLMIPDTEDISPSPISHMLRWQLLPPSPTPTDLAFDEAILFSYLLLVAPIFSTNKITKNIFVVLHHSSLSPFYVRHYNNKYLNTLPNRDPRRSSSQARAGVAMGEGSDDMDRRARPVPPSRWQNSRDADTRYSLTTAR